MKLKLVLFFLMASVAMATNQTQLTFLTPTDPANLMVTRTNDENLRVTCDAIYDNAGVPLSTNLNFYHKGVRNFGNLYGTRPTVNGTNIMLAGEGGSADVVAGSVNNFTGTSNTFNGATYLKDLYLYGTNVYSLLVGGGGVSEAQTNWFQNAANLTNIPVWAASTNATTITGAQSNALAGVQTTQATVVAWQGSVSNRLVGVMTNGGNATLGNLNVSGVISQSLAETTNVFMGKVGIGTNVLNETLFSVASNGAARIKVYDRAGGGIAHIIASGSNVYFGSDNAGGNVNLRVGNAVKFLIDGAGNVGIGTSTPATKLDVNGTTTLRGNVDLQGYVVTNSGCVYTNFPEIAYASAVTVLVSRGNLQLYRPTGATTIYVDNTTISTTAIIPGISFYLEPSTNPVTFHTNNLVFTTNRVVGAGAAAFLSGLYTNQCNVIMFERRYNSTNYSVWGLQ